MAGFNMDGYVDVAERIKEFYAKNPTGSLRTGTPPQVLEAGGKCFVVYHAQAFRTPDDACPADGWAWEPIPGPTPYTKDSELQNAETSAWGRAIVAAGFETKKIASADEVRNRQSDSGRVDGLTANGQAPSPSGGEPEPAPNDSPFVPPAPREQPTDGGDPFQVVVTFGKYKLKTLGQVQAENPRYLEWLISDKYEAKTAETRRIVGAARLILGMAVPVAAGGDFAPPHDDSDIPFS